MKERITWVQWWQLLRMMFTLLHDIWRGRASYMDAMEMFVVGAAPATTPHINAKEVEFSARFGKPLFRVMKEEAASHRLSIRDILRRATVFYTHALHEHRETGCTLELVSPDRMKTIRLNLP